MAEEIPVPIGDKLSITIPQMSDWECELFGTGQSMVLHSIKGDEPNWFWRWMQYLILGNKWRKKQ